MSKHGFPKTTTIKVNGIKRLATTEEQARQLADHYKLIHGIEEPSEQELRTRFKL